MQCNGPGRACCDHALLTAGMYSAVLPHFSVRHYMSVLGSAAEASTRTLIAAGASVATEATAASGRSPPLLPSWRQGAAPLCASPQLVQLEHVAESGSGGPGR